MVSKIKKYGELVMFSHTIFSLPFGLVSMFIAASGLPTFQKVFWIVAALFGARNGANAFNRIADNKFDKKNVRTSKRHLATGAVSVKEAWVIVIFCFLLLLLACYEINLLALELAPVALFMCLIYSFTKRFTWLCHVILGMTCGIAPVGAWVAINGTLNINPFSNSFDIIPIILFLVVTFWVAGFDIIYATQDIEFDRKERLHSIPQKFGEKWAKRIALSLHMAAVILLIAFYFVANMGIVYLIGAIIIALLLAVEHKIISPQSRTRMNMASYSINQLVSIVFLIFASIDLFI